VLVGPSGSGKTAWAAGSFRAEQVVSADRLRALVGEGEHDQRAGRDAFDVLDLVLERRLRRRLLTVVDTLGLDPDRRQAYRDLARRCGVPCHAVAFDTPAAVCRSRNRERARPVPAKVLSAQLRAWETVRPALAGEGFDAVHQPGPVAIVPPALVDAPVLAARQVEEPLPLRFGLNVASFTWPGGPAELADRLGTIARSAEAAGFSSIWVMDHLLQIPQVGREWDEMLDSYTTLGFLAGVTQRVRLGVLVSAITFRSVQRLAKIVATLDVLSGGRAVCGLGAGWFEREHRLYGLEFPPAAARLDLLEDALRLLPLMWGPGAPAFEGRALSVPEALCYPRPLQDRVPIVVGGQGERRTLRLVAQYADACNLFGDPATVRRKLGILAEHCRAVGRDPAEVEVTHLSTVLCAPDRPARSEAEIARLNAGTPDDHIGGFRALAEAGVQTAVVRLADLGDTQPIDDFAPVIAAFQGR
jgi:F420-dependent oxidoreductase-like protein